MWEAMKVLSQDEENRELGLASARNLREFLGESRNIWKCEMFS
jgi:hypothetical protein